MIHELYFIATDTGFVSHDEQTGAVCPARFLHNAEPYTSFKLAKDAVKLLGLRHFTILKLVME